MKIYKITPSRNLFFDMGAIGKCSALYIQADCENDARYFALLNKQTSTTQDVVPGCAPLLFEDMFNKENAECIELEEQEIQDILDGNDLGINLVKVDFWR
ncbi:MAG: hypothetical protein MR350_00750 [Alphaproteobacteria bacterium]|nr:hypothetical protein [Alphaproteobacteria bacterium]